MSPVFLRYPDAYGTNLQIINPDVFPACAQSKENHKCCVLSDQFKRGYPLDSEQIDSQNIYLFFILFYFRVLNFAQGPYSAPSVTF